MSTNPLLPADDTSTSLLEDPRSLSEGKDERKEDSLYDRQVLVLEEQLQKVGGQLIDLYKSNKQWIQVGEIVHTLNSSSGRISINNLSNNTPMEGHHDTISVTSTDDNKYIIDTNHHSVTRSLEDINQLKSHLYTTYSLSLPNTTTTNTDTVEESLQKLISSALNNEVSKQDHILACFLTNKIEDFSIVMHNTDKHTTPTTNGPTNESTINVDPSTNSNDLIQEGNNVTTQQQDSVPTIQGENISEEDKVGSSSGMSIGEYECSPHVPKRQNSLPPLTTDPGSSPQTPPPITTDPGSSSFPPQTNTGSSSPPPPPQTDPGSPLTKLGSSSPPPLPQSPLTCKPESSSEEGSSVNIDSNKTSESDSTGIPKLSAKGRSQSVFYDSEGAATKSSNKKKGNKSVKKNKVKEEELASTVTLATPQLAVEWDPTCLLEELYNDCQPGVGHSQTGENSRHTGYLGKLPVNQRKPSVMKGWKHRFFRLTRGSLFYYDAENSAKATSFIRLSDSKIVQHPDTLKIEIIEKGGNFIMLRAESREDMYAWSRALQLESVHPTMTHRLSLSPGRSDCVIIVDLGSCSVRAGITNDNTYPQMFFPTICAVNEDKVVACGNEALLPGVRTTAKLIYPCRRRLRLDSTLPVRECFQSIFEKICKTLKVEPQNTSVLVCVSPVMPELEQITLCEVLLEILNFKSILIQEQTTMALYSYNHTSGIVVNIGDSMDVVPIIDGFKVNSGTSHSPFGGHSITESLSKLATSHGIRYFSEAEMYVVRFIKESICFLSQDYLTDVTQCEESPTDYKRAVDVDRFQLTDHKKLIHLDSALFMATEGLFNPGVWGKDNTGLHEMVQKAIEQCPIDMRRQIVKHIYLAGGTTLLIGLQERLQKELEVMYPRLEVQVHESDNRHHAAFLGAGVLASLNSFTKSLVDLDTWLAKGLEAMKHNQT